MDFEKFKEEFEGTRPSGLTDTKIEEWHKFIEKVEKAELKNPQTARRIHDNRYKPTDNITESTGSFNCLRYDIWTPGEMFTADPTKKTKIRADLEAELRRKISGFHKWNPASGSNVFKPDKENDLEIEWRNGEEMFINTYQELYDFLARFRDSTNPKSVYYRLYRQNEKDVFSVGMIFNYEKIINGILTTLEGLSTRFRRTNYEENDPLWIEEEINTTPPPDDSTPEVIAKSFTIYASQIHNDYTALRLENPETLTEQTGNPQYREINISPKTYADMLKVGNRIRITGIQVASDQAQVKSGNFDIRNYYDAIELVAENTIPDQQTNQKPAIEIIMEAVSLNEDSQLRDILVTKHLSGDEFIGRLLEWGHEETLINRAAGTLDYAKIKEFLGINSQTPPDKSTPKEPSTPAQENSQKSEENIKDINNAASVAEAQTKARNEINNLLERYGVKAEQLSTSLWENESSWETYLTAKCSSNQLVSQLVSKMKIAILQQNKQNQQAKQQLTTAQLKSQIKQGVEELLQKYPQIKTEQVPALKNWERDLAGKNTNSELIEFENQLREVIIATSRQGTTPQNLNPEPTWPTKLLIGGAIVLAMAGIGFLIVIIRNKRVRQTKKVSKT